MGALNARLEAGGVGGKRRRDSVCPCALLLLPTLCPTRLWVLGIGLGDIFHPREGLDDGELVVVSREEAKRIRQSNAQ